MYPLVPRPTAEILLTLDEDGAVCSCNPPGWRHFGYQPEEMIGLRAQALFPGLAGRTSALELLARKPSTGCHAVVSARMQARRRDGSSFFVTPGMQSLEIQGRRYYLLRLVLSGQSEAPPEGERTRAARGPLTPVRDERGWSLQTAEFSVDALGVRLADDSQVQAAPGILSRHDFEVHLEQMLEQVRRCPERRHSLLHVDLDRFKVINEARGYAAGDGLLRQLGSLLRENVDSDDLIARVGGDSFGVLLLDCASPDAVKVAERLRAAICEHRFSWQERTLAVTASIGAVAIQDADAADTVLNLAEVACYAAKDDGRNRIHLYQDAQVSRTHRELRWVWEITRALEEQRFELYFQPIVALDDTAPVRGHYELLLRLRDEDGRLVPAREFIAAAERYDLISMLDRWVVTEALSRWASTDTDGYTLAINLSGGSLSDGRFLDFLIEELKRRPLPPGALCFEITETAAIASLSQAAHFMHRLKELGIGFSLDDFGTGLSSFSYLKSLPVDYLKIDGQFVRNVTVDPIDRTLVAAISEVGTALGIKTVAECVETREVLEHLGDLGVGYVQGYHLCEPRPVGELPEYDRLRRRLREEAPA